MDALSQRILGTLTPADLAGVRDFRLGDAEVSPSRRTLTGPGGSAALQPRVMQVLVVLAEQPGCVVSRETLFERCWGDVYVGDDSLNRVIGSLRKLASEIAPGSFDIETITRTGYRLIGTVEEAARPAAGGRFDRLTRRELASATLGLAALGAIGGWAAVNSRREQRFEQLLQQANGAIAGDDKLFRPDVAVRAAQEAVQIHPGSARALGMLAFAQSYFAQVARPEQAAAAGALAMGTAQKALALNPNEPNALLATFEVRGSSLDWWSRDRLLRRIVGLDPSNGAAIADLGSVLQAAGLTRESWAWNERLLRLAPLSQVCLGRRALKLWIFGRVGDADNVVNQLRAQFPTDRWLWSMRLQLYAFTGRPAAARSMLESEPGMLAAAAVTQMWRACLDGLESPGTDTQAKARDACLRVVPAFGELAGVAVMAMCALGDLNTAFQIAEGYLLSRGKVLPRGRQAYGAAPGDALHRIDTVPLFMPPCRNMRADARFQSLCEGVGLVEYWRRRGVQPDYLRFVS